MARHGWEGPDDAKGWDLVGGDPAPGDAAAIRTYAQRYNDIADNTEHAGTIATMLKGDQYSSGGAGKTMEQISSRVAELPGWLGKLTTAFRSAGDAVGKYTGVLEQAQADAQRALTMAVDADARLQTANGSLGHARASLSFAAEVARDDKKDLSTDTDYLAAKDAFEAAKRTVAGVQGELDMARQIAADARALRDGAVKTAVTALNSAAEVRVPDRGLGEKIVDWIKNNSWFKWVIGILSFGLAFFGAIGLALSLTLTAIDMGTTILEGVVTGHWDIAALVLGALAFVPGAVWVKAGQTIAKLPGIRQILAMPKVAAFNQAAANLIGGMVTKVVNFTKTLGNLALAGLKNLGNGIKAVITKGLDNVFQLKTVKVDVRPPATVPPVHTNPSTPHLNSERSRTPDLDDEIVWQHPGGRPATPDIDPPIVWERPPTPVPDAPPRPAAVPPPDGGFAPRTVTMDGVTAFEIRNLPDGVGRTFKTVDDWMRNGRTRWAFDPGTVGVLDMRTGAISHVKDAPWAGREFFVADIHGTPTSVKMPVTIAPGAASIDIGVERFAQILESDAAFLRVKENGGSLVLDACNTGEFYGGFADRLADRLGMKVHAPDNPSAKGIAAPGAVVGHGDDFAIPGEWRTFEPGKLAEVSPKYLGDDLETMLGRSWDPIADRFDFIEAIQRQGLPFDDSIRLQDEFEEIASRYGTMDTVTRDVQQIMTGRPELGLDEVLEHYRDIKYIAGDRDVLDVVRDMTALGAQNPLLDFDDIVSELVRLRQMQDPGAAARAAAETWD